MRLEMPAIAVVAAVLLVGGRFRTLRSVPRSTLVMAVAFGVAPNRTTYLTAVAHGLYVATTSRERSGFDLATNTAFTQPGDAAALAESIFAAPDRHVSRVRTAERGGGTSSRRTRIAVYEMR